MARIPIIPGLNGTTLRGYLNTMFIEIYAFIAATISNVTHTGDVTGDEVLTLAEVNATPGEFVNPTLSVDAKGRIVAIADGLTPDSPFMGIALTTDNPGTPAAPCFYIANGPGTYTNFDGLVITGNFSFIVWNGVEWAKYDQTISAPTDAIYGKVISGMISPYIVANGGNTERRVLIAPNTVIQAEDVSLSANYNYLLVPLIAGDFLIGTNVTGAGHGYTAMWCDFSGNVSGITAPSYLGKPVLPTGNYIMIGESGIYSWFDHFWNLKPYMQSNHVGAWQNGEIFFHNPEKELIYDITKYGYIAIDSYVTGYTYVERAFSTTTPVLINATYYTARCEIGTTTFTNFTNGGTPYSITVSEVTIVALKYTTVGGWTHTVLPCIINGFQGSLFTNKDIYIPSGTYVLNGGFACKSITGNTKESTVLMNLGDLLTEASSSMYWAIFKNITLRNYFFNDYLVGSPIEMHNCNIYIETVFGGGSAYLMILGFYQLGTYYNHKFICTNFYFYNLYTCIWGNTVGHIDIIGCRFEGTYISHPIRMNDCKNGADISFNYVEGGTTGIFFGSQRERPIENIYIHNNEVCYQTEEGVSFDGFGNNEGLCPTIANGDIVSVTNDLEGRLVIICDLKERVGGIVVDSPIVGRSNWSNFYFIFEDGSGLEGVICKIDEWNDDDNSLTLDCCIDANEVTIGGFVGVHSGFYNCVVKDNVFHHIYGTSKQYGTAMSIYINVANFNIEGNKVYGCAHAINLAGGSMLAPWYGIAYNNTIQNNTFIGSSKINTGNYLEDGTVRFISYWGGAAAHKQYGNKFINNTVINGVISMQKQDKFIMDNNNFDNCTFIYNFMQDTLPPAGENYVGRKYMIWTNDANGTPTSIKEHTCKLTDGVYSWNEL